MMAVSEASAAPAGGGAHLRRTIGFWGLMFVSLGSIIGSGWLLGALGAAQTAGPASLISWVLAAAMLAVLALIYAELGGAYPVAGVAVATALMLAFTMVNLAGAKLLSESNSVMVIWKTAVPVITVIVLLSISFHPSNFTSQGFAPFGIDGIFAAL